MSIFGSFSLDDAEKSTNLEVIAIKVHGSSNKVNVWRYPVTRG